MSQCDLIVLVADSDTEATIRALLARPEALQVRPFDSEIRRHPYRDNGCLRKSHEFLRLFCHTHARALVIFDREGCGAEEKSGDEIAAQVQAALSANGWEERAEVIVLDPELEIWAWSRSAHVAQILCIGTATSDVARWLTEQNYLPPGHVKPPRPKEAMQEALRRARIPRSPRIHAEIAAKVSLSQCIDPSFEKLRSILQRWFPR